MKKYSFRTIIVNMAVLVVSASVSLLLAEGIIRIAAPQKLYRFPQHLFVSHADAEYALAANFSAPANTHEYKTEIITNSIGIRDEREPGELPSGGPQILAIGDSFTMGVGVNTEQSFVRLLEKKLGNAIATRDMRALNLGVPGYHTRNAFALLEDKSRLLEPSVILLTLFVGNDITQNNSKITKEVRNGYLRHTGSHGGALPAPIREYLQLNSHLYQLIWPLQRQLLDPDYKRNMQENQIAKLSIYDTRNGDEHDLWQATRKAIEMLADTWRDRSVPLVMVVAPEQLQVIPGRWAETLQQLALEPDIYDRNHASKRLANICADLQIVCIDLLESFSTAATETDLYYVIDGHWNERGNDLAAMTVADAMRPLFEKSARGTSD